MFSYAPHSMPFTFGWVYQVTVRWSSYECHSTLDKADNYYRVYLITLGYVDMGCCRPHLDEFKLELSFGREKGGESGKVPKLLTLRNCMVGAAPSHPTMYLGEGQCYAQGLLVNIRVLCFTPT